MNPTSADPAAPPPPPPCSSFSCDRHPNEHYTGFCPSCLCQRLTSPDHLSSNTPSSSRRPSSASVAAATAIKSLFSSASKENSVLPPPQPVNKASNPNSFLPQLRRTKSFSVSKNEALGLTFEPQGKSCDVWVRNTLWSLFTLEDENKSTTRKNKASSSASSSSHQNLLSSQKIVSCIVNKPVLEETENEEDFNDLEIVEDGIVVVDDSGDGVDEDEIIPFQVSNLENLRNAVEVEVEVEVNGSSEIVEEEVLGVSNLKPMKDHINLDSQEKKSSGGGFWAAASVFSKKWQK